MCGPIDFENFEIFKSNAEFWGNHDSNYIRIAYIECMLREGKPLYIITELGKIHKIKKGKLIKQIINADIKFKFINEEIYYSLYETDKDGKILYYNLMED